ncbi:MAG: hypothetical protein ACLSF2_08995 [Butyricicoccus sp.]
MLPRLPSSPARNAGASEVKNDEKAHKEWQRIRDCSKLPERMTLYEATINRYYMLR